MKKIDIGTAEHAFFVPFEKFRQLVNTLLEEYVVIGPVRKQDTTSFEIIENVDELNLDYEGHTKIPPKKFFLPPREILFTYRINEKNVVIEDNLEVLRNEKRILIGIHSCDIHSLLIMDKIFIGEFQDPYYRARRENTIIIGLVCDKPADYCFCYFTKSGPDITDGYDLLLTNVGNGYLVEIGSKNGLEIVHKHREYFTQAEKSLLEEKKKKIREITDKLKSRDLPFFDTVYSDMVHNFDHEIWNELGSKCLACGKCNYACPTCYCFDIIDEAEPDLSSGKRIRIWDSCHFLSFTRVASGEVFRAERSSRVKQRIYHKLVYSVNHIDLISCVGCGRCIDVCSARIDIRDVVSKIKGGG